MENQGCVILANYTTGERLGFKEVQLFTASYIATLDLATQKKKERKRLGLTKTSAGLTNIYGE